MGSLCEKLSYLTSDWKDVLREELNKSYMEQLNTFIKKERNSGFKIYPEPTDVFNAFQQTAFSEVRVVIVGQDPYHGEGQAHGLSFSVPRGVQMPPSLKNIYKELYTDLGVVQPCHGDLTAWAHRGVMLLNATLTVRENTPKSHYDIGWEVFTDAVIEKLCLRKGFVIFVLWGKSAQEKVVRILQKPEFQHHYVLTAAHPSPYSVRKGFFGCRHFSKINDILTQNGCEPIDWQI